MGRISERLENYGKLVAFLSERKPEHPAGNWGEWYERPEDFAATLQAAARTFHRNAERSCSYDCGCRKCDGRGTTTHDTSDSRVQDHRDCAACAGTGLTFGKREARIMAKLRTCADAYRLRVYEQDDPRGWPLYLIPAESGPQSEDDSWYSSRGRGVSPAR